MWPLARGRPPGRPVQTQEEPDQGSGADEGVRPTFGSGLLPRGAEPGF